MGVKYKVNLIAKAKWEKNDRDGDVNTLTKEINILLDGCIEYIKHVFHHEVIHAIFTECGLEGFSNNEILVDFIAKQLPKIVEFTNEADNILDTEITFQE